MKVVYERPAKNESGLYVFKPFSDSYGIPRFGSREEALGFQEQVLRATDGFADFFKKYELPTGIGGEALIRFRLFSARGRDGFRYWKTFGKIGFPDISIQTDLGVSAMYMWPESGHLEIGLTGAGLMDKAVDLLLPILTTTFNPERQVRVEKYIEPHQNGWALSGRVLIPANI